MIRARAAASAKVSLQSLGEPAIQRLLSVLAWADCRDASFLLAAGDVKRAAERLIAATAKLEAVVRFTHPVRRPFWRPMVNRSGC
jgi:hypothetical protein